MLFLRLALQQYLCEDNITLRINSLRISGPYGYSCPDEVACYKVTQSQYESVFGDFVVPYFQQLGIYA